MKIDMHCHVKEGSIDSRVGIEEYITILKEHGFQGMVITDHDTYNGYRYWKKNLKGSIWFIAMVEFWDRHIHAEKST